MKSLFYICLIFFYVNGIATQNSDGEEWQIFKKTYNKIYSSEKEEIYRQFIFFKNVEAIKTHNEKYSRGLATYTVAVNKFADRTIEELLKSSRPNNKNTDKIRKISTLNAEVPESIDWRDYGVITPIVDQDYCLSCWAFAVVAAIEAHIGIHLSQKNQTLSPENLIDCVYSDFNCDQEMARTALEDSYQYILDNGGIDTSDSYPYDQITTECRYKSENIGASIKNFVTIPEGDEAELKTIVGTLGPVSVIISVDITFMVYRHGVYYKEDCHNIEEPYNHAVTVIGYGVEDGQEYWLVKNMWGTLFGDDGYIKMARNRENNCGIATYASYPIV